MCPLNASGAEILSETLLLMKSPRRLIEIFFFILLAAQTEELGLHQKKPKKVIQRDVVQLRYLYRSLDQSYESILIFF